MSKPSKPAARPRAATLPRLVHQALTATATPAPNLELEGLVGELRAIRRLLWLAISLAVIALLFAIAV